MSYYMDLGFVNVENKLAAYELAREFIEKCWNNYKWIIEEEKYYIPSIRFSKDKEPANEYWIDKLFTFNFVYWSEYNLLAIKGCHFPKEAKKLFDIYVPFQNGTDQDYEYSEWSEKIDVFNEIISEVKNISNENIKKSIIDQWSLDNEEETEEYIEYFRRSLVYKRICEKIDFYKLLEGEDGNFEKFSMSAITTTERHYEAFRYCKGVEYTLRKERGEKIW